MGRLHAARAWSQLLAGEILGVHVRLAKVLVCKHRNLKSHTIWPESQQQNLDSFSLSRG